MTMAYRITGSIVTLAALLILNLRLVRELAAFTADNEFASHIALIPLIAAFLAFRKRKEVLAAARWQPLAGGAFAAAGLALLATSNRLVGSWNPTNALSFRTLLLILTVIAAFVICYGFKSLRAVLFPAAFLLLAVPLPVKLLDSLVELLRAGSAEATAVFLNVSGTPFFREGAVFTLPRTSIEIARQCSGIRSSLALFITSLLAAHLMLNRGWSRCVLVLAAVPVAMIKNGVRITAISLLAIHVDMRFLTNSSLHRDGGILFFLLALLLMSPILAILRRLERRGRRKHETAHETMGAADSGSPPKQDASAEGS